MTERLDAVSMAAARMTDACLVEYVKSQRESNGDAYSLILAAATLCILASKLTDRPPAEALAAVQDAMGRIDADELWRSIVVYARVTPRHGEPPVAENHPSGDSGGDRTG